VDSARPNLVKYNLRIITIIIRGVEADGVFWTCSYSESVCVYIYIYIYSIHGTAASAYETVLPPLNTTPLKKTPVDNAVAIQTGGRARVRTINPPPRKGLRNDPENFVFNYRHRRKLTTYLISSFPPSPLPYSPLPVFFLNMISRRTMNRNYRCGRIRVYLTIYSIIIYVYRRDGVILCSSSFPRPSRRCLSPRHLTRTVHTTGTLHSRARIYYYGYVVVAVCKHALNIYEHRCVRWRKMLRASRVDE